MVPWCTYCEYLAGPCWPSTDQCNALWYRGARTVSTWRVRALGARARVHACGGVRQGGALRLQTRARVRATTNVTRPRTQRDAQSETTRTVNARPCQRSSARCPTRSTRCRACRRSTLCTHCTALSHVPRPRCAAFAARRNEEARARSEMLCHPASCTVVCAALLRFRSARRVSTYQRHE